MVPFGLLAGFAGGREVRITELDETGFCFRIRKKDSWNMASEELKMCFYDIENSGYRELEISEYDIQRCDAADTDLQKFYVKYKVNVKEKEYAKTVQRLLYQYNRYIHLKLEEDDSTLAKSMTGYPGERDVVKCRSLEEQMKIWQEELKTGPERERKPLLEAGLGRESRSSLKNAPMELALEIDCPELYQAYLRSSLTDFSEIFAEKSMGSCRSLIRNRQVPDRLYIGNQFCHLLFPGKELLFQMLEKAAVEQVKSTLVFSYIRDYMLDQVQALLEEVDRWCERRQTCIEVVVNDWGMADLVKNRTRNLTPSLGILLNKRKKDPRIFFKKGDQRLFEKNNLNAGFYRNFLKEEFGIERFEWESCGYGQEFPEGKNGLHIPLYQTNTSQYCPLRAVCLNGKRGAQKLAKSCPHYCAEHVFLYPEHLHMVGRYNSLFGIDMEILKDSKLLERCAKKGVDRVVISAFPTQGKDTLSP